MLDHDVHTILYTISNQEVTHRLSSQPPFGVARTAEWRHLWQVTHLEGGNEAKDTHRLWLLKAIVRAVESRRSPKQISICVACANTNIESDWIQGIESRLG